MYRAIHYKDDLGTIALGDGEHPLLSEDIKFQHGPVGEVGLNGVQNEDVIELVVVRLMALNTKFPCRENILAITKLQEALFWLNERTRLRVEQGVEGQNEPHVS